jgi:hypothetical protein
MLSRHPTHNARRSEPIGAAAPPQVDATLDENKPLASRYSIGGFPTLKARHALSSELCCILLD